MTAAEMKLAINGGEMAAPNLPERHHFGAEERAAALRIIDDAIAKVLDKAMNVIRVDEREEIGGLDTNLHKESAYNFNS